MALEVPLGALSVVRRRQGDDTAHARIQPLRDALDDPDLARGVAALEDHDDLLLRGGDPVLKLDHLALEPEEFAK